MSSFADFASMMEAPASKESVRTNRRLRVGEVVEGTIVQIGQDAVFVDVGATVEARVDRGELVDKKGTLQVKLGGTIRASVVSVNDVTGPVLSLALGRGQKGGLDASALLAAKDAGLAVEGTVSSVTKGGIEVQIAGVRAFCPASQVELGFVKELDGFLGQSLSFLVLEVKDNGRSVVVSRRALLERQRAAEGQDVLARLAVGSECEGTVASLQKYGAFIELGGGVDGLVHISEISHTRVERVEDVLSVGEKITVKVLAIEPTDKGPIPKLRLSMKALSEAPVSDQPVPGQVLDGVVAKIETFGVFVETEKGTGLVPARETGLPRGSDLRRAFPIGKEVRVVLANRDNSGRISFSIARVAAVEERQNYHEFTKAAKEEASAPSAMGSFGALLSKKLNLPPPAQAPAAVVAAPTPSPAAVAAVPATSVASQARSVPASPPSTPVKANKKPSKAPPAGVVRRRRD